MSNSSQVVIRQLKLGDPYPGRPHSVLVQIPTWADMVDFGQGKARMDHGYPRSVVHPDIHLVGISAVDLVFFSFLVVNGEGRTLTIQARF